jgi:hypothetical protein
VQDFNGMLEEKKTLTRRRERETSMHVKKERERNEYAREEVETLKEQKADE